MEPKQFYSSLKKRKLDAVELRNEFITKNPIPVVKTQKILGHTSIWKTFKKQNEALSFMKTNGMDLMTFAYESAGSSGQRSFVVAHPNIYWDILQRRPLQNRCSYEIIPDNESCKLYFDLEYQIELNKLCDGDHMTKQFIDTINYFILKEFQIQCTETDILNLDSSTPQKFSRHLIYNHKSLVFNNNISVGKFVKYILSEVKTSETDEVIGVCKSVGEPFMIRDNSGGLRSFCDTGVYTKNRNFRLYNCTKYGKSALLKISHDNKYPVCISETDIFLQSLISYIPEHPFKILKFGTETSKQIAPKNSVPSNVQNKFTAYPEVQQFILSIINGGYIRNWNYFQDSESLIYEISNYRYCFNVGRQHRSNGIMFVVNLKKGIYYQKCHDPDCFGFKSREEILPDYTMPWKEFINENLDEDVPHKTAVQSLSSSSDYEIDDQTLLNTAIQMGF